MFSIQNTNDTARLCRAGVPWDTRIITESNIRKYLLTLKSSKILILHTANADFAYSCKIVMIVIVIDNYCQ